MGGERDDSGNTYTVGRFWDYSNFKDYTTLDAVYPVGGKDGYIAKYDSNGDLLWAKTFGSTGDDHMSAVRIGSDGNIIALGTIIGDATFWDGGTKGTFTKQLYLN